MKPEDGGHHRAGSVRTDAGKALQIAARTGQFPTALLDDAGQLEECPGFLLLEA